MIKKIEKVLVESALGYTRKNVNSACFFVMYQPKLPVSAIEKLKKN